MNNGGAPFRTGGYSDWHGMSRFSPVCNRILPMLLRLSPGQPGLKRFVWVNLGSTELVLVRKYAK